MPDRRFYVEASKGKKITGDAPAQFLMRNGAYVMNPTPGGLRIVTGLFRSFG